MMPMLQATSEAKPRPEDCLSNAHNGPNQRWCWDGWAFGRVALDELNEVYARMYSVTSTLVTAEIFRTFTTRFLVNGRVSNSNHNKWEELEDNVLGILKEQDMPRSMSEVSGTKSIEIKEDGCFFKAQPSNDVIRVHNILVDWSINFSIAIVTFEGSTIAKAVYL